jgi:hypothetical protein
MSDAGKKDSNSPSGNGNRTRPSLGGPSTDEGKAIAKFNATKHGIFSTVVVLKWETRASFDSLLDGLMRDCQPQGRLEEILVEKLAMILWRHRRLLISEGGEISKTHRFLIWEKATSLQDAVTKNADSSKSKQETPSSKGLFWDVSNLKMLDRCLELLSRLRDSIETDGFEPEYDERILKEIYGSNKIPHEGGTLADSYKNWCDQAIEAEDPTIKHMGPSEETCRKSMLSEFDLEVVRLKQIRDQYAAIETERNSLELLRSRIPEGPQLERLLRYEASLERSFDRTLAQLERLQRIRRGQPVPPRLEVDVTV